MIGRVLPIYLIHRFILRFRPRDGYMALIRVGLDLCEKTRQFGLFNAMQIGQIVHLNVAHEIRGQNEESRRPQLVLDEPQGVQSAEIVAIFIVIIANEVEMKSLQILLQFREFGLVLLEANHDGLFKAQFLQHAQRVKH